MGQRPYALSCWPWAFPLTQQFQASCQGPTKARNWSYWKTRSPLAKSGGNSKETICVTVETKMWGALGRTAWLLLASGSLANPVDGRCFCSGVANQCREATSYYWATLRQGFRLLGRPQSPASNLEPLGCRLMRGSTGSS